MEEPSKSPPPDKAEPAKSELSESDLDKVVGGVGGLQDEPIFGQMAPIFAKMTPIFAKVVSYRDRSRRDLSRNKVSMAQLYEELAAEPGDDA